MYPDRSCSKSILVMANNALVILNEKSIDKYESMPVLINIWGRPIRVFMFME